MDGARLIVVAGKSSISEVPLVLPATIGRAGDMTVSIPQPLVSRRHCEIVADRGRLVVRDLGSLNGTYVGKERVQERVLQSGDLLTVGTLTFRIAYGSAAEHFETTNVAQEEHHAASLTAT